MIKEELGKIVNENRAMRREEEYERLKKQQDEQALKDEIIKKWRESNKTEIEDRIERCFIECAKKTDGYWIRVNSNDLTIDSTGLEEFFDVWDRCGIISEIRDKEVKAYCKKHKLKFRYWYHRDADSFLDIKRKDKYVHWYTKPFFDYFNSGASTPLCFEGYVIHI